MYYLQWKYCEFFVRIYKKEYFVLTLKKIKERFSMKNIKKATAVLLSVLLLVSLFSIAASAETGDFRVIAKSNVTEDISVDYDSDKDNTVTVSFKVQCQYPIMNCLGWMNYDQDFLTLESFELGKLNNIIVNTSQVDRVDFNSTEVTSMADFSKESNLVTAKFKIIKQEGHNSSATNVFLNLDELNASNNNKDVPIVSDGKASGDVSIVYSLGITLSDPYSEPEVTTPTNPNKTTPKNNTNKSTAKKKTVKKSNPIKVKGSTKTVKLKKLKKKNQTIKKALKVTKAKGKLTYKIVKNGTTKKIRKFVKINKKGVITFKKWKKAKKGTYKVKVTVTAAGNKSYKKGSKSATVKIKVKK